MEQKEEGERAKERGKNETQKRLCISHQVQRVRKEKKRKRRGTNDVAGEGEDNSNRGKAGRAARTSKEWRWLKGKKLFLIISTGQF